MNEYHKIQTVFLRNPKTEYKTLLENNYALPEFNYLKDLNWIWTEKVDGTNIRVIFDGNSIIFKGKTDKAQIPNDLNNNLNNQFQPLIDNLKEQFQEGICFYGEGYGAKIQKGGGNYNQEQKFVLFDIKIGQWWLKRSDVEKIATELKIDIIPIIGCGNLTEMVKFVKNGFNSKWGAFQAEGIVAKPIIDLFSRNGQRIITKIKYKDFMRI